MLRSQQTNQPTNHTTPHHTTPHRTAPHRTAPTTPHHTAPHHQATPRKTQHQKKYRTPAEKTKRQWGWGRKHTHAQLSKGNKAYNKRAGEDGKVEATRIDETPQRARFAQVGKPKKKILTQKEAQAKQAGYGRKLGQENVAYKVVISADADWLIALPPFFPQSFHTCLLYPTRHGKTDGALLTNTYACRCLHA